MKPLFRGESRWRELRCTYCDQQWTGACSAAPAIIHQLAALEKTRGCQCSCRGPWPPRLRPPGRPGQRSADTKKLLTNLQPILMFQRIFPNYEVLETDLLCLFIQLWSSIQTRHTALRPINQTLSVWSLLTSLDTTSTLYICAWSGLPQNNI